MFLRILSNCCWLWIVRSDGAAVIMAASQPPKDPFCTFLLSDILLPIFVAAGTTLVTLWIEKKRDAKLGRHRKLYNALSGLRAALDREACEEITKNPFCLLYKESLLPNCSLQSPYGSHNDCKKAFIHHAEEIKEILDEDNNTKPWRISTRKWNAHQRTLLSFAGLIINAEGFESKESYDDEHTKKYRELEEAVRELMKATKYAAK